MRCQILLKQALNAGPSQGANPQNGWHELILS